MKTQLRALIEQGERFFSRHGGKSVFIGRFIPGVKSVVPGIAGMFGMDYRKFSLINVTSAFAWAAAHILPGMLLSAWLKSIGLSLEMVIIVGTLVLVALFNIVLGLGFLIDPAGSALNFFLAPLGTQGMAGLLQRQPLTQTATTVSRSVFTAQARWRYSHLMGYPFTTASGHNSTTFSTRSRWLAITLPISL